MRKHNLVSGNIYHIYNRGVEKRQIFLDERDYKRFLANLAIFNDKNPSLNTGRNFNIKNDYKFNNNKKNSNRKPLVDILAFCLMPNHYHLLLKQRMDNGITEFMRKIGVGYVNYFNLKHKRVGSLFQGRFKSVLVDDESQFTYIPYYIHLNPLDLISADWREKGIGNKKRAIDFLDSYKWSSHRDYNSETDSSFILGKDVLNEYFNGKQGYQKDFNQFIKDFDFSENSEILID